MRRVRLVKGTTKKAIAMASAFMMTFGTAAGNVSVISSYAETSEITEYVEGTEQEENVTAEENDENGENDGSEENAGDDETDGSGENAGNEDAGEADGTGENEETGESEENGGSEETGNSVENGEDGITGESEETDVSKETGSTEENKGTGELEGSGEDDATEETENNDKIEESDKNNDVEKSEEIKETDEEAANTEKQQEITAGVQQTESKQQIMMFSETGDSWYIAFENYEIKDGYYYITDEITGNSKKITDQYIEKEMGFIIYVDETGEMVTRKWLGSGDEFRYANSKGKIIVGEKGKVTAGFYGDFDDYGYWTPSENVFFEETLDNGITVTKYVEEAGRIAGIGGAGGKKHTQQYCFKEEAGTLTCYLLKDDGETIIDTPVTDVWVGDLRVDGEGHLLTEAHEFEVDGKYYDFDSEGHSLLLTNTFIGEGENRIYVDNDGNQVISEFVEYDGRLIYFDENGKQVFHDWIEYNGGFRYVNSDGNMVVKSVRVAKGYYGKFDENGYWTPISYKFCSEEQEDETFILRYAVEGGKIAETNEGGIRQRYIFEQDGNITSCYLPGNSSDNVLVKNTWIADLWINEEGHVLADVESQQIDGKYYTFDEEGHSKLITGAFVTDEDGSEYYVGEDGVKLTDQIVKVGNDTYYVDADGKKVKSQFVTTEGSTFYFGADGKMVKNQFITDETGTYCLGDDGRMVTNQFATSGDDTFYFGENGLKVINQFVTDKTGTYYVGADGKKLTSQLVESEGDTYYVDADGKMVTNQFATSGEGTFYFGADGKKVLNQFVTDETGTYYVGADGKKLTDQFINVGTDTYYVDADGKKVTGQFATYGGETFYFGEDGKKAVSQFVTDESGTYYVGTDGKKVMNQFATDETGTYYLGTDGRMTVSQFVTDGTDTYYVGSDGRMVTNQFATYGNDTFYFGADGKKVVNQFVTDGTGTYYVGEDGTKLADEMITVGTDTYYIDADGKKVTSQFVDVEDDKFYFDEDGKKAFNRLVTDETGTYYVGVDGRIVTSQFVTVGADLYCVDENGRVVTNQFATYGEDTFYFGTDGKRVTSRFVTEGPDTYYVGADGKKVTKQFATYGNDTFYFGEDGKKVTNQFVSDATGTYYVGADGRKVTSQFVSDGRHTFYMAEDGTIAVHRWLNDANGFRYVNGKGYMLVNTTKVAGGFYGRFDADGYWTDISNTFFKDELSDGTIVTKYSGAEGKVAGIGEKVDGRKYFCFEERANGTYCYLITGDETPADGVQAANVWISDMWVNADGYLAKNSDVPVDGVYYHFDKDGHGTLITYRISYVLNGGTNSANPSSYNGAMDTIVLGAPTRSAYRFDGWYTDSSFTNRITEIPGKSFGDITLYAKWEAIYTDSDSDDGDDSYSSTGSNTNTTNTNTATNTTTNAGTNANVAGTNTSSPVSVSVGADQSVTVQHGEATISADLTLTSAGSLNNNTIVSVKETAAVTLAEGQKAEIATIAVGADGSTRSLLASQVQGATVQQTTITVQGVTVTQNAVVYADGTKVAQKSGAVELEGFAQTVIATEQAIQTGSQTLAAAYNDKVEIDLNQYQQVGAAVAYEVIAGVNGTVSQTQVEQTSFAPGQEVKALITDAAGNVSAVTVVVGENGVVQYPIPGVNCIVRFMVPKAE